MPVPETSIFPSVYGEKGATGSKAKSSRDRLFLLARSRLKQIKIRWDNIICFGTIRLRQSLAREYIPGKYAAGDRYISNAASRRWDENWCGTCRMIVFSREIRSSYSRSTLRWKYKCLDVLEVWVVTSELRQTYVCSNKRLFENMKGYRSNLT